MGCLARNGALMGHQASLARTEEHPRGPEGTYLRGIAELAGHLLQLYLDGSITAATQGVLLRYGRFAARPGAVRRLEGLGHRQSHARKC